MSSRSCVTVVPVTVGVADTDRDGASMLTRGGMVSGATGAGAGSFSVADTTVLHVKAAIHPQLAGRWYVEHGLFGLHEGELGPVEWSFDWTAPSEPMGTIHFYVAGNAANGSEEPSGDYIYTSSAAILDTTTGARTVSWGALKSRRR